MYIASVNRIDDEAEIRALPSAVRSAEFVTVDPDGFPVATLLPILWEQLAGIVGLEFTVTRVEGRPS